MSFPFVQPYFGLGNSLQTAQAGGAGGVGGWVELGRTTLGGTADAIDVSSLPNKRYYMVLLDRVTSGNTTAKLRVNSDSGSNYAYRYNANGTENTSTSQTEWNEQHYSQSDDSFWVGYFSNLAGKEKLGIGDLVSPNGSGAGVAPDRAQGTAYKWTNTSDPIDEFNFFNSGAGDYASGSEAVVLGWDPADTHTTNFWEELASVTTGSAGDTLQSGTILARKYLWVQASYKNDGGADINALPRFNGDGSSNYSKRTSTNGASDNTRTSRTWIDVESGGQTQRFANMFIINNASNEKLCIFHQMDYGGSGASTAPNRIDGVAKWTNTSDQITSIEWDQRDAGDYAAGAELRVWGSD
jgi:hypothetical protein